MLTMQKKLNSVIMAAVFFMCIGSRHSSNLLQSLITYFNILSDLQFVFLKAPIIIGFISLKLFNL